MTQKSIVIKSALDARQAAYFVQTAGKFEAEIHVSVDEKKIN
ncbi:MAG: HPr family phosphocarrier protein, partial [Anaerotignum sp.]|nr:HPr family phosphocarrier protein [Anaerotignum sp.]